MVIQLNAAPRPLVQFTLCQDAAQMPFWDTKLDYRSAPTALRLLAYGVAISEEGSYLCSEIAPFERHPLIKQIITAWDLFRSRRTRKRILRWWPDQMEADKIEQSIRLMQRRVGQGKLRRELSSIWKQELPAVTMYSIDGERTWKDVAPENEDLKTRMSKLLEGKKTIDPDRTCLMLSDRGIDTTETDRRQWLTEHLDSLDKGCSIYTPAPRVYSRR